MVQLKKLEDRVHFVVPVVLIVEGVLNGSEGPLYYPAEELKKSAALWNGKPVVVYHPDMYYSGIAGNPEVFNRQKIGTLFNVRFENKSLKGEAWLDPDRLKRVDERVLEAVEHNRMVEVSTGLFTDNENVSGEFNGIPYRAIARNYRPDHLAILPDKKGACSIEDGAGLCRNYLCSNFEEGLYLPNSYLICGIC